MGERNIQDNKLIELTEEEDIYDNIPPGIDFDGKCERCNRETTVRMLMTNSVWKDGPYDKFCAYESIYGEVPRFRVQGGNFTERLYQRIIKRELPNDRKELIIFRKRIGIVLLSLIFSTILGNWTIVDRILGGELNGFTVLWVVLIFVNGYVIIAYQSLPNKVSDYLNPKEAIENNPYTKQSTLEFIRFLVEISIETIFFGPAILIALSMVLLPITLGIIASLIGIWLFPLFVLSLPSLLKDESNTLRMAVRGVKNFNKYGQNHAENFELIWNGKIRRNTKPLDELKKQEWIFVLRVMFGLLCTIIYLIGYFLVLTHTFGLLWGIYYPIILFFTAYGFSELFGGLFPKSLFRQEILDEMQQEMINRYFMHNGAREEAN